MTTRIDDGPGRTALLVCHCAGMVDMFALPVWMEVLITDYRLGPQRAGALISIFLLAAVLASGVAAARFTRLSPKRHVLAGLAAATAVFAGSGLTTDFLTLALLYIAGGAAIGSALSMTHGMMGRSANPHRMFALAGASAGVFSIGFYAATGKLATDHGGASLFYLLAAVTALAFVVAAFCFPKTVPTSTATAQHDAPLPVAVWLAILGVSCMALNQAMMSSFLQNIGLARLFGDDRVKAVLIFTGIVALFPGPLAAWLQGRASARSVLVTAPVVQVAVSLVISQSTQFWPYAIAGALLTSVQIFAHTFAFGFIARNDPTGRSAAATPAMLMTGSALGPFLAGSLVATQGYPSLGYAVALIGLVAMTSYAAAARRESGRERPQPVTLPRT